jgi:hypothetical protein
MIVILLGYSGVAILSVIDERHPMSCALYAFVANPLTHLSLKKRLDSGIK